MLTHPTHDRLVALGLAGMAKAFDEQQRQAAIAVGLRGTAGSAARSRGNQAQQQAADHPAADRKPQANAIIEDVDMQAPRGLDKALFQQLTAGKWIARASQFARHRPVRACFIMLTCLSR